MRKLILWNVITLDGYFEGEKPWDLSFHELVWGEELEEFSIAQLKSADMLIFGKATYEGMAAHWSKAEDESSEIAKYMNETKKVVCSKTLENADWNNTSIATDAVSEISKLKEEGEGDMYVFGSANLSDSLIKADLFDEYRICISPALIGKGKHLFKDGLQAKKLKLLEARPLKTGGVLIRYSPL